MFRNLNTQALRVSGRQSELIELALTYRFKGLDIDLTQFHRHTVANGFDHANRFLDSAKLRVGSFALPVQWHKDETYQDGLAALAGIAETAAQLGSPVCTTSVMTDGEGRPYHENFELQRQRITEMAEVLKPHGIRLGLGFSCVAGSDNAQPTVINTVEALMTLVETIVSENVGVIVDLFEWHFGGGKLDHVKKLGADKVVMVRANDAAADATLENLSPEKHRLLPMASGVIDAAEWADLFKEMGVQCPLTPFPHPLQLRGITRDRIVKMASDSIDKMLREVAPIHFAEGNGHPESDDGDSDIEDGSDVENSGNNESESNAAGDGPQSRDTAPAAD